MTSLGLSFHFSEMSITSPIQRVVVKIKLNTAEPYSKEDQALGSLSSEGHQESHALSHMCTVGTELTVMSSQWTWLRLGTAACWVLWAGSPAAVGGIQCPQGCGAPPGQSWW